MPTTPSDALKLLKESYMGKGKKKKMANPSYEILKPQHDEYVERFEALVQVMTPENREEILPQVDRVLDLHAADYPELITEYIVKRGMEALEV